MYLILAVVLIAVVVLAGARLVAGRRTPPVEAPEVIPGVGDDASEPRDTPLPTVEESGGHAGGIGPPPGGRNGPGPVRGRGANDEVAGHTSARGRLC